VHGHGAVEGADDVGEFWEVLQWVCTAGADGLHDAVFVLHFAAVPAELSVDDAKVGPEFGESALNEWLLVGLVDGVELDAEGFDEVDDAVGFPGSTFEAESVGLAVAVAAGAAVAAGIANVKKILSVKSGLPGDSGSGGSGISGSSGSAPSVFAPSVNQGIVSRNVPTPTNTQQVATILPVDKVTTEQTTAKNIATAGKI
jgi:hypothetical protein